ncbi:UNVERIFIED_CONTAM: hypothetical protein Sangu_1465200 [Sesamum angustifolium]|uniref:Uncharacterized protein n=1 Tax=Sesamum angustifolium TaxID=2727405 RepID=A0AAW2NAE8_9LAMI
MAEQGVLYEGIMIDVEPAIANAENAENAIFILLNMVNILSDSSVSSRDFCKVIEYYASGSDPDAVLALRGVPSVSCKPKNSSTKSSSSHS